MTTVSEIIGTPEVCYSQQELTRRVRLLEALLQVAFNHLQERDGVGMAQKATIDGLEWKLVEIPAFATDREVAEPPTSLKTFAHNPAGLSDEQIGVKNGWRLLYRDEIHDRHRALDEIHIWNPLRDGWVNRKFGSGIKSTYRTNLSRDELAIKSKS